MSTPTEDAIDRLVDRLTGLWLRTMFAYDKNHEQLGFRLKAALEQTEALTRQFCELVIPDPDKPKAAENGKATQPTPGKTVR